MELPTELWNLILVIDHYKSSILINKQLHNLTKILSEKIPKELNIQLSHPFFSHSQIEKEVFCYPRKSDMNCVPSISYTMKDNTWSFSSVTMTKNDILSGKYISWTIGHDIIIFPLEYDKLDDIMDKKIYAIRVKYNIPKNECYITYVQ